MNPRKAILPTMVAAGGGVLLLAGIAIATGLWQRFIVWLRPFIVGFEPPV